MKHMNTFNSQFLTRCACGGTTSKQYARAHGGKCKTCVTGVGPVERRAKSSNLPGGFQDVGEYHMSAEYAHEVRGGNDLSPD